MKTKQVTRYTCDFCGKTQYSLGSMRKHEAHCTLNHERECRMCEAAEDYPAPTPDEVAAVVALIPKLSDYTMHDDGYGPSTDTDAATKALESVWPEIVDKLHGCPACIMAALRQGGFPLPLVTWWSYTDACKEFWKPINAAKTRSAWSDCM